MSKRTRKIPKLNTTLLLFYVGTRNFLKVIRGNGYRFVPKGGTFCTETITLVVRSSGLWEAYTQTCPQMGQFFYHNMLMPLHDTMPSFMNFRRFLYLLEFKTQVYISTFCRQSTVPSCLRIITISCMGPKHAPKDIHVIFQPTLVHWSMCL